MCGIVGYVGGREAVPVLIEGLSRLEYRGYDSAGIAILGSSKGTQVFRRVGRVRDLEAALPRRLAGQDRHRAHPVGHPRPGDRAERPPAEQRRRPDHRRPQRHHRQRRRAPRPAGRPGRDVHLRDRHRDHRPPGGALGRGHPGGRRPGGPVPDHRDLRHPGHGPAPPRPAGRRPQRLPAHPRRRRPRDVRGQRPVGHRPAHRLGGPPRRRRAGHGQGRRVPHVQPGGGGHGQVPHHRRPGRRGRRGRRPPALHVQGDPGAALLHPADAAGPPGRPVRHGPAGRPQPGAARAARLPAGQGPRLRLGLLRRADRRRDDRGAGPHPGRRRARLGVPLPEPDHRARHPVRGGQPVGRDGRHRLRRARGPPQGRPGHRAGQRGRLDHRPGERRRHLPARRPGGGGRLDQGPDPHGHRLRHGGAGPRPGPGPVHRRRAADHRRAAPPPRAGRGDHQG